jgi:hypothetical protein
MTNGRTGRWSDLKVVFWLKKRGSGRNPDALDRRPNNRWQRSRESPATVEAGRHIRFAGPVIDVDRSSWMTGPTEHRSTVGQPGVASEGSDGSFAQRSTNSDRSAT